MRRAFLLVSLALAAAGCGTTVEPYVPAVRAPPQEATLDWVERYPAEQPALLFGVRSFAVTATGWRAEISIENRSGVGWEVGAGRSTIERAFGVLLFPDDDLDELERRNRDGTLPTIRPAGTYEPALPQVLGPGKSWSGTISAPGPLAGGLWVRLSFGPFTSIGDPPAGAEPHVVWFTDRTYRLRAS